MSAAPLHPYYKAAYEASRKGVRFQTIDQGSRQLFNDGVQFERARLAKMVADLQAVGVEVHAALLEADPPLSRPTNTTKA